MAAGTDPNPDARGGDTTGKQINISTKKVGCRRLVWHSIHWFQRAEYAHELQSSQSAGAAYFLTSQSARSFHLCHKLPDRNRPSRVGSQRGIPTGFRLGCPGPADGNQNFGWHSWFLVGIWCCRQCRYRNSVMLL